MASNDTVGSGITANSTTNNSSTSSSSVSLLSHLQDVDFMLLECKLVLAAVSIIYLGSHAALRRPPSAKVTDSRKKGKKDEDEDRFAQGLEPTDAIMFPVLAGIVLVGLYYLIQWLKDPAFLNKILKYYMATMSLASVLTLYTHGLDVAISLIYPTYWRAGRGSLYKADPTQRKVLICDNVGNPSGQSLDTSPPLPGPLGRLLAASPQISKLAWDWRDLLTSRWAVKLFIHGMGEEVVMIRFSHVTALLLSIVTALTYFSTSSPFLTNMLGYAMCYSSFLILSPTDFMTGSMVLWGLFFYDIVMVFYTPYMITVATALDAPIKLTFEVASRKSILGLGDIVIPGIIISWALRLDLWMHYARRIKYETTDLSILEKDAASGEIIKRSESKHREVKSPYMDARNRWGDALWTRGVMFLSRSQDVPPEVAAARFPKVYFLASLTGYLVGMSVTLVVLVVSGRGQPALLYLVPGVLGALVITALARGEFKPCLWKYTENGSLDTVDVVVELDGDGNPIKTVGLLKDGVVDLTKDEKMEKEKRESDRKEEAKAEAAKRAAEKRGHKVLVLSIEALSEWEGQEEMSTAATEAKPAPVLG